LDILYDQNNAAVGYVLHPEKDKRIYIGILEFGLAMQRVPETLMGICKHAMQSKMLQQEEPRNKEFAHFNT